MELRRWATLVGLAGLLAAAFSTGTVGAQRPDSPRDAGPGRVAPGTRVLVRLQEKLSTKDDKAGKSFTVRTLEPLATPDGIVLREGAEVRGHIDRVESAGKIGRARLWLTFDDVRTPTGWRPLVAELIDAPGVHSIRVVYNHEGEIEANASKRQGDIEAAGAGAMVGAAPGMAAHDKREAAIGAAVGAATAFMTASALGQDIVLDKDTKLDLVLGRPLWLSAPEGR